MGRLERRKLGRLQPTLRLRVAVQIQVWQCLLQSLVRPSKLKFYFRQGPVLRRNTEASRTVQGRRKKARFATLIYAQVSSKFQLIFKEKWMPQRKCCVDFAGIVRIDLRTTDEEYASMKDEDAGMRLAIVRKHLTKKGLLENSVLCYFRCREVVTVKPAGQGNSTTPLTTIRGTR